MLSLLATPAAATPRVPALDWQPCDDGYYCATATVPLDYASPAGDVIHIAVIKHPATDPAHRIGSLFFNPGGPGGSGVAGLPLVYQRFPAPLRAQFDLVSFDPRGVGQSTDLKCFDSTEAETRFLAGLPGGYPVSVAEQRAWEDRYIAFDRICAAHAGPLLAHDSTADVARDMDLLRQAVGDPALNYLGVSYGSYLGTTYANLYPDKVRAIVLDGDVDPVQWATGVAGNAQLFGIGLRLGSDQSSASALNAFLDLCGQAPVSFCAFSAGSPAATRAKFDSLMRRLDDQPVAVGTPPEAVTVAVATATVVSALYSVHPVPGIEAGWSNVADFLQTLWSGGNSGGSSPLKIALPALPKLPILGIPMQDSQPYAGSEAQLGVFCSDSPNPRVPTEYSTQANIAALRSGWTGPNWAWTAEPCAQWPTMAAQRYTGPWNMPTAQPILLIGNTTDPATPYQGALALSRDLADARLLTVQGYGHTALLNQSSCANAAEVNYFRTDALPPPGTVCQQDVPPFS